MLSEKYKGELLHLLTV